MKKLIAFLLALTCLLSLCACGQTEPAPTEPAEPDYTASEADIAQLKELIGNQDSVEGVEYIAENELGLVDPDTIILDPNP